MMLNTTLMIHHPLDDHSSQTTPLNATIFGMISLKDTINTPMAWEVRLAATFDASDISTSTTQP
jgi:hypothetical protein|eukprot:scaffold46_cov355-Alexandrium_tamarense.AAC.1